MEKAGYITRSLPSGQQEQKKSLAVSVLAFLDNVTEEEATELATYLAYLRWRSGKTL